MCNWWFWSTFKMSDLGLLHYYLSIEVKQSMSGISLSQYAYVIKILERSDMTGHNSCHVPMEDCLKLSKQSTQPPVDATAHQSIVRSLRYLMNTHPNPTLAAVKKILRYVVGTCNWGLWFGRKKGNKTLLIGFSDADFAGDVDTRKSTTGVMFLLTKQKVVAQSSCESEYIAAANAMRQSLWLARVLAKVQGSAPSTPLMRVDNKSIIALIKIRFSTDRVNTSM
jgi:hypothetical protein